jgi:hypothetical protein
VPNAISQRAFGTHVASQARYPKSSTAADRCLRSASDNGALTTEIRKRVGHPHIADGDATAPGRVRRRSAPSARRFLPGANVSAIARSHGLDPSQLFAWRSKAPASGLVEPLSGARPCSNVYPWQSSLLGLTADLPFGYLNRDNCMWGRSRAHSSRCRLSASMRIMSTEAIAA